MRYVDFYAIKRIISEYPHKDNMIKSAEMRIICGQQFDITGIRGGIGKTTETKGIRIASDRCLERMKLEKAAVEWAIDTIKSLKQYEEIMKAVDLHLWKGCDIVLTAKKMGFSESSVKRRLSAMYQAVGAYMGLLE